MNSGYARERRADDADTREEHQPLVCLGSPPQIDAARGEHRKVEEGGDVCANKPWQLRGAQAVRRRSRDRANIHHQTHDDHDDGQYRARDTQASMDVRVAGRDERSLNREPSFSVNTSEPHSFPQASRRSPHFCMSMASY